MTSESDPRPLKRPRKQRQAKACWPCRKRKVKCEGPPCKTCTLRGQASKCSMERESTSSPPSQFVQPSRTPGSVPPADSDATTIFASTTLSETEPPFSQNGNFHLSLEVEGLSPSLLPPPVSGSTPTNRPLSREAREVHLPLHRSSHASGSTPGASSVGSPARLDQIWTGNIFEMVGDESNVIYPLQDFYSQRRTVAQTTLALPSDTLIRRDEVLERADSNHDEAYPYDASWFALLYAVLASGAQCLSTIDREAELNSKVFSSVSLSCLRNGNFLVLPTLNSLQALLQIGNCLRNDMNPGLAWSLLGLTIRHAQIMGCHKPLEASDNEEQDHTKLRLWWTVVWQDMIFALCYNHPSGTLSVKTVTPPLKDPSGIHTFTEVIIQLCSISLRFLRHQVLSDSPLSLSDVQSLVQKIELVYNAAQPHLVDVSNCITLRDHVEYWALRIYINHATAQILLKDSNSPPSSEVSAIVVEKSQDILEAFLKLRQFSILTSHSWPILQSCVLAARFLMTRGVTGSVGDDNPRGKTEALVKALLINLRSSCGENLSMANGFSTGLSQTVGELEVLLDEMRKQE
ncbi:uncharacterized protein PAC_03772 [Phialocephala subalpina]|uniref:Zn(2)-C6 fungal-type domain-containing protein n=1 Tax=Phialocephala subalpina TaxID=576137 RepID=A0A1L7WM95_9HELO|nr:uncharacterized protein PAC_03772 [Phialocephala subalpina]